jgi:hypothetical protein
MLQYATGQHCVDPPRAPFGELTLACFIAAASDSRRASTPASRSWREKATRHLEGCLVRAMQQLRQALRLRPLNPRSVAGAGAQRSSSLHTGPATADQTSSVRDCNPNQLSKHRRAQWSFGSRQEVSGASNLTSALDQRCRCRLCDRSKFARRFPEYQF